MNDLAINPMTGEKMTAHRKNTVLTFRLSREEQKKVEQLFGGNYDVIDCSHDFTDFLGLPAKILIANPLEMDQDDLVVCNDWLSDGIDDAIIVFTHPFPIKAHFIYHQMNVDAMYRSQVLRGLL